MVVLRWLLVLAFSVVVDLANPALPGALEALAETEDAIHLSARRRVVDLRTNDDRAVTHRARTVEAARVTAFRQRRLRPAGPAANRAIRKVPPPGLADAPAAPDDH